MSALDEAERQEAEMREAFADEEIAGDEAEQQRNAEIDRRARENPGPELGDLELHDHELGLDLENEGYGPPAWDLDPYEMRMEGGR